MRSIDWSRYSTDCCRNMVGNRRKWYWHRFVGCIEGKMSSNTCSCRGFGRSSTGCKRKSPFIPEWSTRPLLYAVELRSMSSHSRTTQYIVVNFSTYFWKIWSINWIFLTSNKDLMKIYINFIYFFPYILQIFQKNTLTKITSLYMSPWSTSCIS